ncbi:hypothetical protein RRG08_014553 [Elysia crispata]|uniref:Uncharacterized protein n=1 Tax=Elysia crispata TaxID=231223 RepID=A0AAE0XYP6_9GAST|nr:hypothetical protein RRG08_014553 [Elysia crispata]
MILNSPHLSTPVFSPASRLPTPLPLPTPSFTPYPHSPTRSFSSPYTNSQASSHRDFVDMSLMRRHSDHVRENNETVLQDRRKVDERQVELLAR